MAPSKRANGRGGPSLELHLGRDVFATGNPVSGVVILRLSQDINIRSLSVCLAGMERPASSPLVRAFRRAVPFFEREMLLSGALKPRLASDRLSLLWNALLGRYKGRTLSAGEHTYPFSINLPASLPPSYEGRAGKIDYRVSARLRPAIGKMIRAATAVPVVLVPRVHRGGRQVALTYPAAEGTIRSTEISMTVELPEQAVAMGGNVQGRLSISNPGEVEIPRMKVGLEVCEYVRLAADREIDCNCADSVVIESENATAASIEADFNLGLPQQAPPTVDGTAISVIWLLKLTLETDPPIEFKTPITVYCPYVEE